LRFVTTTLTGDRVYSGAVLPLFAPRVQPPLIDAPPAPQVRFRLLLGAVG
jgi:hypothetical protein